MHKTGILGGTFNPIHMGHLMMAEWVKCSLGLQEVWFIPSGVSYMKKKDNVLKAEDRFYMTKLAINGNEHFKCLDMELKRPGNTYTYETLEELKKNFPDHEFYFLTGADCLFRIETWKEPAKIFSSCVMVVANRENYSKDELLQKKYELETRFDAKIVLVDFPEMEISSTMIRRLVSENKSIRYLAPDNVIKYIYEKGFYRG